APRERTRAPQQRNDKSKRPQSEPRRSRGLPPDDSCKGAGDDPRGRGSDPSRSRKAARNRRGESWRQGPRAKPEVHRKNAPVSGAEDASPADPASTEALPRFPKRATLPKKTRQRTRR